MTKNTQILNLNLMLNLKRTSLILATTISLNTAIFPTIANAESTVYEGSNGGTVYRGRRHGVVKPKSGSDTVFSRGRRRGIVKPKSGSDTVFSRGRRRSIVKPKSGSDTVFIER